MQPTLTLCGLGHNITTNHNIGISNFILTSKKLIKLFPAYEMAMRNRYVTHSLVKFLETPHERTL